MLSEYLSIDICRTVYTACFSTLPSSLLIHLHAHLVRILGFESSVTLPMKQFKTGNVFSWHLIHYFNSRFEMQTILRDRFWTGGRQYSGYLLLPRPPSRPLVPGELGWADFGSSKDEKAGTLSLPSRSFWLIWERCSERESHKSVKEHSEQMKG